MPKSKEMTNHPCHFLSLPSAKRFWCRHCMSVFENAITRWRHSRTCRYGTVDNFIRRRELEAKAFQGASEFDPVEAPVEARLQQSLAGEEMATPDDVVIASSNAEVEIQDPSAGCNEEESKNAFTCFICHQKFATLEQMRVHVRFPCQTNKVITSQVPHPKQSVSAFLDQLTHRSRKWCPEPQVEIALPQPPKPKAVPHSQPVLVQPTHTDSQSLDIKIEYNTGNVVTTTTSALPVGPESQTAGMSGSRESITPTNIYVNDQGETVIEVENLDLSGEGGELSLAHLLTQLSQQGIVFDRNCKRDSTSPRQSDVEAGTSYTTVTLEHTPAPNIVQETKVDEDEGQPTAEDAANTLAQLAGFRGFRNPQVVPEPVNAMDHHQHQPQPVPVMDSYSCTMAQVGKQYEGQAGLKYEFQYTDTPGHIGEPTTEPKNPGEQISLQEVVASTVVQQQQQQQQHLKPEEEDVSSLPIHFYNDTSGQTVAYFTTQGDQGQPELHAEESFASDQQRVIVDESTGSVLIPQFSVAQNTPNPTELLKSMTGMVGAPNVELSQPTPCVAVSEQTPIPARQNNLIAQETPENPELLMSTDPMDVQAMTKSGDVVYEVVKSKEVAGRDCNVADVDSSNFTLMKSASVPMQYADYEPVKVGTSTQAAQAAQVITSKGQDTENGTDGDEFTIQTVSLQEIVDPNSNTFGAARALEAQAGEAVAIVEVATQPGAEAPGPRLESQSNNLPSFQAGMTVQVTHDALGTNQ